MKRHLVLLMLAFLIIANPVKAGKVENIVETKDYFPIDTPHSYVEAQGDSKWHITFLGAQTIDNRQVYVNTTTTSTKDTAERFVDKSIYTINDSGDILKVGSSYTNWLNKWYPDPEVYLKGKMKVGTSYTVLDGLVNGDQMFVYLTLKRRLNMKLLNCTKECILVEKNVIVEKSDGFSKTVDSYFEWRYYAKGIGQITYSGRCYNCQCCNLVPYYGKFSLYETENNQ